MKKAQGQKRNNGGERRDELHSKRIRVVDRRDGSALAVVAEKQDEELSLEVLPSELILQVLGFLSLKDVVSLGATSKELQKEVLNEACRDIDVSPSCIADIQSLCISPFRFHVTGLSFDVRAVMKGRTALSGTRAVQPAMIDAVKRCAETLTFVELRLDQPASMRWVFWKDMLSTIRQHCPHINEFQTDTDQNEIVDATDLLNVHLGLNELMGCKTIETLHLPPLLPRIAVLACLSQLTELRDVQLFWDYETLPDSEFKVLCDVLQTLPHLISAVENQIIEPETTSQYTILKETWPSEFHRILLCGARQLGTITTAAGDSEIAHQFQYAMELSLAEPG